MNPTAQVAPVGLPGSASSASSASLMLATTIVLSGCASSLSGVGGTQSYACKAPIGAQCTSVSGVYANANPVAARAVHDAALPSQNLLATMAGPAPSRQTKTATPAMATGGSMPPASAASTDATATPTPAALRSAPRVMRLWIAPWEDADGDLHDASFVHVVVDTGRWLIDRVRPAARAKLDIATPPLSQPLTPPSPSVSPPEKGSPVELSPIEP